MFSGHGGPGHELRDGVGRMTGGQFCERLGHPGVRVDTTRVEIVGRVSGRRHWTVEQKLAILRDAW
jgi:hypothetical protein